jgi:hypothetical protein
MRNEDFEKIMDTWADREPESAPEMRPTPDMYRMVQARKKEQPKSLAFPRWAMAGTVVASLVVLAILYTVFVRPSTPSDLPSGQEVAYVGQREGFVSEKGIITKEPGVQKGKGPTREIVCFKRLWFQFQKQDSRFVEGIDLQAPPEERIMLSSADNYRLLLEPARDCYVYVFQLTSSGILAKLFPNEKYSSVQNPLRRGQTYHLPSEPNSFYLDEERGRERLYVVASVGPILDLEDLYTKYSQADDELNKQEILSNLLEELEAVAETHSEALAWLLVFDHR